MMVLLGVVAGLGAGAIDAGLNTYVAAHFGEGLMQWLHASYGIGVTLGPIIMTIALTSFNSWRVGYRVVGGFQIVLATCFVLTLAMWNRKDTSSGSDEPKRLTDYKTPMGETLRQPQVWLSALLFFLYVGAEVSLGTWTYSLLTESRGIDPAMAGLWAGSYWATFTVGRVMAGLYAKRVGVNLLVQGSLVGALLGAALLVWNPSEVGKSAGGGFDWFFHRPHLPGLDVGHQPAGGCTFCRQYHWHANGCDRFGNRGHSQPVGGAGTPVFVGGYPHLFGGGVPGIVWILPIVHEKYKADSSGKRIMRIQSLAGTWEFRQAGTDEWLPASVPGGVHTDLLALGRIPDPFVGDNEKRVQWVAEADWEYRHQFIAAPELIQPATHLAGLRRAGYTGDRQPEWSRVGPHRKYVPAVSLGCEAAAQGRRK